MNSRERVLTAINHREPDRVPLFFNALEAKFVRAFGDGDMVKAWKRLGVDVFVLGRKAWCEDKPSRSRLYGHPSSSRRVPWRLRLRPAGMGSMSLAGGGSTVDMWEEA